MSGAGPPEIIGPERQLTEPFGFGTGDSITLTAKKPLDEIDEQRLIRVLEDFSCYPPAVRKILACLRHSGRYDCTLQSAWFRKQHRIVTHQMAQCNVSLAITNRAEIPGRWA